MIAFVTRCWVVVLWCALMVGCSTQVASTPAPVPTLALVPAAPTLPSPTASPTPTASPILAPLDVISAADQSDDISLRLLNQIRRRLNDASAEVVDQVAAIWPGRGSCAAPPVGELPRSAVNGYELLVVAGERVYLYRADLNGVLWRCAVLLTAEARNDLLARISPVARALVDLSRRRLVEELNLPPDAVIALLSMEAYTWPDGSLGCPIDGQVYAPVEIAGYRIELGIDEQRYVFHTDFERIRLCPTGNEVLPG